jgi:hypothetical protein
MARDPEVGQAVLACPRSDSNSGPKKSRKNILCIQTQPLAHARLGMRI